MMKNISPVSTIRQVLSIRSSGWRLLRSSVSKDDYRTAMKKIYFKVQDVVELEIRMEVLVQLERLHS